MLGHFHSKSDQGGLRCRAAGHVSTHPTKLSGENGTKKCYNPIWVSYSKQNRGQAISVQTLSAICDTYLGTSKNHALRHSFAVASIRSGVPITDLADALGHTSIIVTQRYTKELNKSAENPYGDKLTARFGIKRKAKGTKHTESED